jgi:hypothetical protein
VSVKSTVSIPLEVGLRPTSACDAAEGRCITCGDEGIEMRIVAIGDESATCTDEHGEAHEVAIDLVQPVRSGDGVLVHAGVAIRHLGALR